MGSLLDIRKGICPVCSGKEIVTGRHRAVERDDDYLNHGPICLSYDTERESFTGRQEISDLHGQLQSYICCDCGYTQMYTLGMEYIKSKLRKVSDGSDVSGPYR